MSDVTTADKTLGEQMWDLLERNPENYDVTFSVGLEKKEVKAVKFLLKAASRVFQKEFEEKWEEGVIKDGEGIPLPDVDPIAFQLAIQLLIQDMWSVEVLKSLNLAANTLLSLLGICRRFEITKAVKNLEEVADEFLRSFHAFKDTDDFLKLTQSNLSTLFSLERIPMEEKDIFDCACRWAEYNCSQKSLDTTGENIRACLGPCLFEIRFPAMSTSDFTNVVRYKRNLLTADEKLNIFEFIGLNEEEKSKFDKTQILFKTQPRKYAQPKFKSSILTLNLTRNLQIHANLPFVCDGEQKYNATTRFPLNPDASLYDRVQISNGKIAVYGIGFFGPVLADAHYDVTVQIQKYARPRSSWVNEKLEKRLFARKQEIFYFMFDAPVVLQPIKDESTWNYNTYYFIYFTLKGPDTMAIDRNPGFEGPMEEEGISFRFFWQAGRNQCAEYLYKKL